MQSNAAPNQIQMSESTARMLMGVPKYRLTKRGIVKVKGKGEVNTYWLNEWRDPAAGMAGHAPLAARSSQGPSANSMLGLLNDANGSAAGASNGLRNRKSSMGQRRGSAAEGGS